MSCSRHRVPALCGSHAPLQVPGPCGYQCSAKATPDTDSSNCKIARALGTHVSVFLWIKQIVTGEHGFCSSLIQTWANTVKE